VNIILKTLLMPFSNKTKSVDAVQLWEVRWTSRHGEFSGMTSTELEGFTSEELANEFAQALRNAFKLIKHSSGNRVTVSKAD
jgi:hypothetical protein